MRSPPRHVLRSHSPRSLKTNSLKLHETITEMSARIIQLEEALSSLQSQVSPEPHPLLSEDHIKVPLAPKPQLEKSPMTEEETEVIDSLGAFSIGEKGEVTFHEATANSEVRADFAFFHLPWLIPLCSGSFRSDLCSLSGSLSNYLLRPMEPP